MPQKNNLWPRRTASFLINWIKLLASPQKMFVREFDVDQVLLFEGGKCNILWNVAGAAWIKLSVNGRFIGNFFPLESAQIDVTRNASVELLAVGPLKSLKASIALDVKPLRYRMAECFSIQASFYGIPGTIEAITVRSKAPQPVRIAPAIHAHHIVLDTAASRQAEILLQEQITQSYS